jgi:hypothetical protein
MGNALLLRPSSTVANDHLRIGEFFCDSRPHILTVPQHFLLSELMSPIRPILWTSQAFNIMLARPSSVVYSRLSMGSADGADALSMRERCCAISSSIQTVMGLLCSFPFGLPAVRYMNECCAQIDVIQTSIICKEIGYPPLA